MLLESFPLRRRGIGIFGIGVVFAPIFNLSVFRARNFAPGVFVVFAIGIALYGSLVLLPIFLQTLLGCSAMQSGLAGTAARPARSTDRPRVELLRAHWSTRQAGPIRLSQDSTGLRVWSFRAKRGIRF